MYNTKLLSTEYQQTLAAGEQEAVTFIPGMSPVAWQHVNLFGSFEFGDEDHIVDMQALDAYYADSAFWHQANQVPQGKAFD